MAMLSPILVSAQFSLSGRIINSSNQPLAGATINLNQTIIQSDSLGRYVFTELLVGNYVFRVSYMGYETVEKQFFLHNNLIENIELKPDRILDEVIVRSTRATNNSATTFKNLSRQELEKNNLGQDLPFLLNQMPSVVVASDAGAGVGYTGIRIRGTDPTRINVTLNGIPYNDAESQGTFFVDLPDFASSIDNIQVQRGVGTSTNGAGAFGASINIQTTTRRDTAYVELNNSYGSYNTWKNTVNAGTGLIGGKFSLDGRLSRIKSDGYIDRAFSNLKSYFLSGAYYGKNSLLRANVFSGNESTYQAWNGVPENLLATNRTYNGFTYSDQTDNYQQDHYQILYSHQFADEFTFNGALYYTKGKGYYEEYKADQELVDYGFQPVIIGTETVTETDLVRRRWLDNDLYGFTYSVIYTTVSNFNLTFGGAYNEYDGKHFGQVTWAQYASNGTNNQHYYDEKGIKTDFNTYIKASYKIALVSLFADLQYRRITYSFLGYNRNLEKMQQKDKLNFFNPKVGISYQLDEQSNVYASIAVAHREPNRRDYTESAPVVPKPERLTDFELGYRVSHSRYNIGINGYYMGYKNQLVVTGQINDVGGYLRENVPNSYRMGIELDAKWQLLNNLSWTATAAVSQNKVKNFREFIDSYDAGFNWLGQQENRYGKTDIAFSPSFIASSELSFNPIKNTEMAFLSKYVSKQYLDNTSNKVRKLNAFLVNDVRLRYNFKFKHIKNMGLTLVANNIFSEKYESNGYTFSYVYDNSPVTENYYFPQATRNFLLSLNVKF